MTAMKPVKRWVIVNRYGGIVSLYSYGHLFKTKTSAKLCARMDFFEFNNGETIQKAIITPVTEAEQK